VHVVQQRGVRFCEKEKTITFLNPFYCGLRMQIRSQNSQILPGVFRSTTSMFFFKVNMCIFLNKFR
jgi:hypothetical protein